MRVVQVWRHRDLGNPTATLVLLRCDGWITSSLLLQGWCPWRRSNMSRDHDSWWRLFALHLHLLLLCCGSAVSAIRPLNCRFVCHYLVAHWWLPVSILFTRGPRDRARIIRVNGLRHRARLHKGCSLDFDARFAQLIWWIWLRFKIFRPCWCPCQTRPLSDIVISKVVLVGLVVNITPSMCLPCVLL